MQEFDDLEKKMDDVRDAAAFRAAKMIRAELVSLKEVFPNHTFEFRTGMYSPYVMVDPPLHGQTRICDFDIDTGPNSPLRTVAKQRKMQTLREHISRMDKIAIYTNDTFHRDVQFVTLTDGPDIRVARSEKPGVEDEHPTLRR
jgi:hypothetical protein